MNIGVILAGGTGSRMGIANIPKQFIDLYGKPVVVHTLEAFEVHEDIDAVCVVCLPDWQEDMKIWIRQFGLNKVKWVADAGDTRQRSTMNALKVLKDQCAPDDILIVHDAARPMISQRIITENIEAVKSHGACDTVIPAHDTIARSLDGVLLHSIPVRRELFIGQTPQSFRYSLIEDAYQRYYAMPEPPPATDDCGLALMQGIPVAIAMGDKLNLKITTFEDLLLVKSIIRTSRG